MKVESRRWTDKGARSGNEDAYLVDDARMLYAVADGMGGHAAGEVASALAIAVLDKARGSLESLMNQAHGWIVERSRDGAWLNRMGTTLTALSIADNKALVAHVGDSACYLVRDGQAQRLTEDQSRGHILLNCIGVKPDAFHGAQITEVPTRSGDVFVLCTDGLTNYVNEQIPTIAAAAMQFPFTAQSLVKFALGCGGHDNVTVVAVRVS